MKTITKQNLALIAAFARELARNLRAQPLPVEVVGGAGPRRPRPENGRRGTDGEGRRGPQTAFMAKQRKVFLEHLKVHPETASVSRITRARECWAIHRKEWDAAAKKGIGYADYKGLARANLI